MKLDEFVKDHQTNGKCQTCRLPKAILDQVHAGRHRTVPISYGRIAAWLKVEGHDIKLHAIRNHFVNGHAGD